VSFIGEDIAFSLVKEVWPEAETAAAVSAEKVSASKEVKR
jgi:hypothetical protein